ncbi:MAG: hypothetical protein RI989_1254, partial [Bacteroidota bacterium]
NGKNMRLRHQLQRQQPGDPLELIFLIVGIIGMLLGYDSYSGGSANFSGVARNGTDRESGDVVIRICCRNIIGIQTVVVGRKTYEVVQGMGVPYHPEKQVFVISKNPRTSVHPNIHFFNGNVKELFTQLKSSSNHNIYCDGGSQLANSLIQEGLIDEIIVSVAPIYLNKGTLLFEAGKVPQDFELFSTKEFSSGLVQYHYALIAI